MNFTKTNIPVARGMQPTRFDKLLKEFVEPGDSLSFDEADLTKQQASACAKRLMILDPTRKFHSFYNVLEKKVVVRVRPDGEIPEKEEPEEEPKKVASLADFDGIE